ncbi:hypothetical protein LCGC14_1623560 [marine sediment metagenome]|uniref:Uncharacterized protein n=1 Tax=marine sediment metagenome TaxID=412755 RepID=A0A0F9I4Q6_9ZZZZ
MKNVIMPGESVTVSLNVGSEMPTGTGAQTLLVAGADSEWRDITEAPRDGTVIEIQNNYGVAPTFRLSKWVSARGWVDATDENMGTSDGPHLSWRPFDGDPTVYVDPTGGAQNTNEYWLRACGMSTTHPQPRQTEPWWKRLFGSPL